MDNFVEEQDKMFAAHGQVIKIRTHFYKIVFYSL